MIERGSCSRQKSEATLLERNLATSKEDDKRLYLTPALAQVPLRHVHSACITIEIALSEQPWILHESQRRILSSIHSQPRAGGNRSFGIERGETGCNSEKPPSDPQVERAQAAMDAAFWNSIFDPFEGGSLRDETPTNLTPKALTCTNVPKVKTTYHRLSQV